MHHKGINLTLEIPITRLSSRKRKKDRDQTGSHQRKTKNILQQPPPPSQKEKRQPPLPNSKKTTPFF
jgi:hypothetical protein